MKSIVTPIEPSIDYCLAWGKKAAGGPWLPRTYVLNGGDGRYGAISFKGAQGDAFDPDTSRVVGAFFSAKSERHPDDGEPQLDLDDYFVGCPAVSRQLAKKGALQFLLFECFPGGPCATAVFWNDRDDLASLDPWTTVLKHGGDLLQLELLGDDDSALDQWADAWFDSPEQVELARNIYARKRKRRNRKMQLTKTEAAYLASLSDDPNALDTCKRSFLDINIVFPE